MNGRQLAALAVTAIVWLAPVPAASQSADSAAVPPTPWGDTDLQGVWDFRTLTPMERPDAHSGKEFLTNFLRETNFTGSSAHLHLVERFTRVNADTLLFEFTVEDPMTFTRAWTAQIPMRRSDGALYEYACHEGNYGMFNLLAGARADERAAAEASVVHPK